MRKILTLLIGTVFLITVLNAKDPASGVGNKADIPKPKHISPAIKNMDKAIIFIRAIETRDGENVEKHLAMFDSGGNMAIDGLYTGAQPGATVIWKLERFNRIKRIKEIVYTDTEPNPFKEQPHKRFFSKGYKAKLSEVANGEYKYKIVFIHNDGTERPIDPYLRVPPPSGAGTD
jgi:hypothetical protein